MAAPNFTSRTLAGETTLSEHSTWITASVNNVSDSDNTSREKHISKVAGVQYPHGLTLVLLAGASIVAVFMIALDQVSTLVPNQSWQPREE